MIQVGMNRLRDQGADKHKGNKMEIVGRDHRN